ncbi:MAG TPA: cysteinyl-tRNA synthetase [Chloroflexota bacterium]|nr:cysteinyl-tRNA synthetase [Chloroflexota bacterium]
MSRKPGPIVLFGSGESLPEAQPIHDSILKAVARPVRACILETPAGFETNSPQVAGRLGEYLRVRLQNYRPEITIVPARRRGTAFSPDDQAIAEPIFGANYLMMGPGSPSYTVRQLRDSFTWHAVVARHRLGYPLVLASAATIAVSDFALPVYEIYKVGEELHWKRGLNLLGPNRPSIAFVPHWDNNDGGKDLDTSRCFMGKARFAELRALLPPTTAVVGIDERTALILDFTHDEARVMGAGGVTLQSERDERRFGRRETFPLADLGLDALTDPAIGLPNAVWEKALAADSTTAPTAVLPSDDVLALIATRARARASQDWAESDRLRDDIARLGWKIKDTPNGAEVLPLGCPHG